MSPCVSRQCVLLFVCISLLGGSISLPLVQRVCCCSHVTLRDSLILSQVRGQKKGFSMLYVVCCMCMYVSCCLQSDRFFVSLSRFRVFRRIKEQHCYCAPDLAKEYSKYDTDPRKFFRKYTGKRVRRRHRGADKGITPTCQETALLGSVKSHF